MEPGDGSLRLAERGPAPRGEPAAAVACPTCGADAMRRYCAECGERRVDEEDLSLRRFLGDVLHAVTNLDSSVLRSLAALVRRPGLLTAEHLAGRRRPYVGPLRLFLLCNILFFLLNAVLPMNVFSTRLGDQLRHHPYSGFLVGLPAVDGMSFGQLMQAPEAYRAYERRFAAVTTTQAKTLVILMVPLFALLSYSAFGRARRYYVEHLVFSLHLYAFVLLLTMAAGVGLRPVLRALAPGGEVPWEVVDTGMGLFMIAVMVPYLAVAARRAFGLGWWRAALGAVVLIPGFLAVLYAYRFILFFTTTAAL